jgi:hypothetical protein
MYGSYQVCYNVFLNAMALGRQGVLLRKINADDMQNAIGTFLPRPDERGTGHNEQRLVVRDQNLEEVKITLKAQPRSTSHYRLATQGRVRYLLSVRDSTYHTILPYH